MLETRALFIGLREALGKWHLCDIYIGATWAKETSHANINISLFGERDGSRFAHTCVSNLRKRKGGQVCKSVRGFLEELMEGGISCILSCLHMCEQTLRV